MLADIVPFIIFLLVVSAITALLTSKYRPLFWKDFFNAFITTQSSPTIKFEKIPFYQPTNFKALPLDRPDTGEYRIFDIALEGKGMWLLSSAPYNGNPLTTLFIPWSKISLNKYTKNHVYLNFSIPEKFEIAIEIEFAKSLNNFLQ